MTIRILSAIITSLLFISGLSGQVTRSFQYEGKTIPYLAQNNRMDNVFSQPGFQVFILIADSLQSLDALYAGDSMRLVKPTGMRDYTCFYYLPYCLIGDGQGYRMIDSFIQSIYYKDFIDRNRIFLIPGAQATIRICKATSQISAFEIGIYVRTDTARNSCAASFYPAESSMEIWLHSKNIRDGVPEKYSIPGFAEMERTSDRRKRLERQIEARHFNKKVFVTAAAGPQFVGARQQVAFDTTTLVDFTDYKTVWSFYSGYHLHDRLAAFAGFSFLYSGKRKQIDNIDWDDPNGIKISGSGKAAAMYRYGAGFRLVPFSHAKSCIILDVFGGRQKAVAGGGTATRIIGGGSNTNEITRQEQTGHFITVSGGGVYLFNPVFGLNANLIYNHAPLDAPVGSVSGFSGLSFNLGLSVYFNTGNRRDQ
jgi:hypothetical protein